LNAGIGQSVMQGRVLFSSFQNRIRFPVLVILRSYLSQASFISMAKRIMQTREVITLKMVNKSAEIFNFVDFIVEGFSLVKATAIHKIKRI
jgi:hypothetical protein